MRHIDDHGYGEESRINRACALGQETRLDVFRLLVRAGAEGLSAGQVTMRLGTVQNTMSAHFKVLSHAGMIRAARRGRTIRYFADITGFRGLLAFLTETAATGRRNCASR